jgi:hypothetical protein
MDMRLKTVLALVVGGVCFAGLASGRLMEPWDYERLFKEADLVVIGAPVAEEKADDPFGGENHWGMDIVGMNTVFEVKHALKGKTDGTKIKMLHFRFDPPKDKNLLVVEDGPQFVAIRHKSLRVQEGDKVLDLPAPEYLLFLRRLKDGRYEPVSGKVDPQCAVREVSVPLDDTFGARRK